MGVAPSSHASSTPSCCSQHSSSASDAAASCAASLFSAGAAGGAHGGSLRAAFPALGGFRDSALARTLASPGGSTALGKARRRDAAQGPVAVAHFVKFLLSAHLAWAQRGACRRVAAYRARQPFRRANHCKSAQQTPAAQLSASTLAVHFEWDFKHTHIARSRYNLRATTRFHGPDGIGTTCAGRGTWRRQDKAAALATATKAPQALQFAPASV